MRAMHMVQWHGRQRNACTITTTTTKKRTTERFEMEKRALIVQWHALAHTHTHAQPIAHNQIGGANEQKFSSQKNNC